jgi:hypothetical protein
MDNLDDLTFAQLSPTTSKYLKQDDVGENGLILTVKGFTRDNMDKDDGSHEEKTVLHFVENVNPMVLGPTNAELLRDATGATIAREAKGKQIVVFADRTVMFGGKRTGGLRIKRIPGPPSAPGKSYKDKDAF